MRPISPKRHFGKEGEVFVRSHGRTYIVWAYDDYGILWHGMFETLFGVDMSLFPDLFTIHASRNLR